MMRALLLIGALLVAQPVLAQDMSSTPEERLEHMPSELQQDARALWARLRCVVCAGQSIAQSNAPIAHDIRLRVIEELAQGKEPATIEQELAMRYGADVLLAPPAEGSGRFLWLAPLLFLTLGVAFLTARLRKSTLSRSDS